MDYKETAMTTDERVMGYCEDILRNRRYYDHLLAECEQYIWDDCIDYVYCTSSLMAHLAFLEHPELREA
jgi:hypothetical protein